MTNYSTRGTKHDQLVPSALTGCTPLPPHARIVIYVWRHKVLRHTHARTLFILFYLIHLYILLLLYYLVSRHMRRVRSCLLLTINVQ